MEEIEMVTRFEIEQEIELAKMMAEDIDKVFKKYAKAALQAQQDRTEKVRAEKYKDCENVAELQDLFGYGDITLDEYDAGRDFFESREERMKQLSLVEKHRKNLKEIRDRWKGTINELKEELNEIDGVVKDTRNAFEKLDDERRVERFEALRAASL